MIRQNLDDLDANGQKGDWCFLNDDALIALQWGERLEICIIKVKETSDVTGPIWQWNGSKETPTLSPSIRVFTQDKTLWHGFLREGKLVEA